MSTELLRRRRLLASCGSALAVGLLARPQPASAQGIAATPTMRGGSNNYLPGAPIVERIGGGGFWMTGTVRRAGDGAPLAGQRIQIWAHTTEGHERDARSHGATLTDADGVFWLEMPQIVPAFGQPHGHLAYDSGEFETGRSCPTYPIQAWKRTSCCSRPDAAMGWALIWIVPFGVVAASIGAAAMSPLLAWRDPIYITAGFAGILGLALMLFQPLLAAGWFPGLQLYRSSRVHRWVGAGLVTAIAVHVVGLWITSPPDVIDALTFTSPTPFSNWGVVALWAIFVVAAMAVLRRRLRFQTWRIGHSAAVATAVLGTIVHSILIQGTMEPITKAVLCGLVGLAALGAIVRLRPWAKVRSLRS